MENLFKDALLKGDFAITCEIIPGRGAREESQEKELENARQIFATGRVHAISITDNPSGNPALLADYIGKELIDENIVPLVHFTCKDRSRNQIISQLYGMERYGIENVLFMTGDYEGTGWRGRARPVFDLDSVQVQMLAREMNEGLVIPGRKKDVQETPTHFFQGGVVNPFKYLEGETIPQYLKMEKKIIAGAEFLITQVGFDARKMEELIMYRDERGFDTPLIANIFLLTKGAAKLMRKGTIAGCYVSDELMEILEEESQAEDKGKAARIERAAEMAAVAKGLGYAGIHIGGFGVNAQMVEQILDRMEELAPTWRTCVPKISFGRKDGYYIYEPALDENGVPTGLNAPEHAPKPEQARERKVFKRFGLSRIAHYWMLTLGKRGNKLLARIMDRRDRKKGIYRHHGIEHTGKSILYSCMDCGDCGLEPALYTCPMTQCPKCQRNGPCGGTYDGWCEVFPGERYCIWYKAYHKAKKYDEMERMTSYITPPNHWELFNSSPWSAYTHKRDNTAGRIPVALGLETGTPGGVTEETDLHKSVDCTIPKKPIEPPH